MEKKDYPRVLVISSSSFNDYTGTGVTLSNLFRDWPKDKLALIHSDNLFEPNIEICDYNYKHSLKDRRLIILSPIINIIKKIKKITHSSLKSKNKTKYQNEKIHVQNDNFINGKLFKILDFMFGNLEPLTRIVLTEKMRHWILEFKPEIIYSTFSTIGYMKFINDVQYLTKAELAVHFMDDWPSVVYKKGLLSPIFRFQMGVELKKILRVAKVKICIGTTMSSEYRVRYGYDFLSFSNPEDSSLWEKVSEGNNYKSNDFNILYVGTFNSKNINTIEKLSNVVNKLKKTGEYVYMDLFSFQPRADIYRSKFEKKDSVSVKEVPKDLSEFRKLLCSGDLLIIPLDYTNDCVERMRLSFFTKIPAYMFSGVPILLCGPKQIGVVEQARNDGWAYVVSEDTEVALESAILKLMNQPELRENLITRSKILASERHDASIVKEKFRLSFLSILSNYSPILN